MRVRVLCLLGDEDETRRSRPVMGVVNGDGGRGSTDRPTLVIMNRRGNGRRVFQTHHPG